MNMKSMMPGGVPVRSLSILVAPLVALALATAPTGAHAKKSKAQKAYKKGVKAAKQSNYEEAIKHFEEAMSKGDVEATGKEYKLVVQKLDKTAATSTMHKKTAARKKSRLAKRLNALKAKKS